MVVYSYKTHSGDAAEDTFAISVDYLEEAHLKVYVDDTLQVDPTHYSVVGSDVVFVSPPAAGTNNVLIQRVTPRDWPGRGVDFSIQTFLERGVLDTNQKWIWYLLQEAHETDDAGKVTPTGPEYIRYDSVRNEWDAGRSAVDTRLGGLADPTSNDDAATKKYVDDVSTWGTSGIPQVFNLTGDGGPTYLLNDGADVETEMCVVAVENGSSVLEIQQPLADFNITKGSPNSTLVFASAVTATRRISVINLGKARGTLSIGDGTIETRHLADLAVTTGKLAADAVDSAQIADDAVDSEHLAPAAVDAAALDAAIVALANLKVTGFTSAPGGGTDQALLIGEGTGDLLQRVLAHADISDFAAGVVAQKLNSMTVPDGSVDLNSQKIVSLLDPTAAQDAATKAYVDGLGSTNDAQITRVANETLGAGANEWQIGTGWISSSYDWYQVRIHNWQVSSSVMTFSNIELHYKIGSTWYWDTLQLSSSVWMPAGAATSPTHYTFEMSSVDDAGTKMFFSVPEVEGLKSAVSTSGAVTDVMLKWTSGAYNLNTGLRATVYAGVA